MREPHKKGSSARFGSESCARVRKDAGEALTGVRTGQVWSSEIITSVCQLHTQGESVFAGDLQDKHPYLYNQIKGFYIAGVSRK